MPKDSKRSRTQPSEYKYEEEVKHNSELAQEWLETIFPEFAELKRVMGKFDIGFEDLLDMIYNLRTAKNHGWGSVEMIVEQHNLSRIETRLRTIVRKKEERTLPKNKM